MSSAWACPVCFVVQWHDLSTCARCGSGSPAVRYADSGPREPDTQAVHLQVPPVDFPYTRTRPARARAWIAPVLLVLLAAGVAVVWNPAARAFDAAAALGGTSAEARDARRAELAVAATELGTLAEDPPHTPAMTESWRRKVHAVAARRAIAGTSAAPSELADAEARLRAAWLELLSLPLANPSAYASTDTSADLRPRWAAVRAELSHVTEDLTHAR